MNNKSKVQPVEETVTEAPQEEAAPVKSFNHCHECDGLGLINETSLCSNCGGKGKLGV